MQKYQRQEQKEKRGNRMTYYAVIDTNVFISALLSKNNGAATVKVLRAIFNGIIVPLYHNEILAEYNGCCIERSSILKKNLYRLC